MCVTYALPASVSAFPIIVGVVLVLVLAVGAVVLKRTCEPSGWTDERILVHSYSTCILMGTSSGGEPTQLQAKSDRGPSVARGLRVPQPMFPCCLPLTLRVTAVIDVSMRYRVRFRGAATVGGGVELCLQQHCSCSRACVRRVPHPCAAGPTVRGH